MAIDRGVTALYVKACLVLVYIVYAVWASSSPNVDDFSQDHMYREKGGNIGNLSAQVGVLGGSNVAWGVSAGILTDVLGPAEVVNLGVILEGGGVWKYLAWVKEVAPALGVVVYSPVSFWEGAEEAAAGLRVAELHRSYLPQLSLYDYIRSERRRGQREALSARVDSRGDLLAYSCFERVPPKILSRATLASISSDSIVNRLAAVREISGARVVFRPPPLYVPEWVLLDKDLAVVLDQKLSEISSAGFPIVGRSDALISDPANFCDASHHLNRVGRDMVSRRLGEEMRARALAMF